MDNVPQSSSLSGPVEWDDEKYTTPGQQLLTTAEGAVQGLAGPAATYAEKKLSDAGVPGLTPEDQARRAEQNPGLRYGTEAGAFGVSSLYGVGEAGAVARLGKAAELASGVGKASLTARIASSGIRTGAEVAALQAGNEVSKAINEDPNQTWGSAAASVGLAAILGGAAGVPLGAVSELWTKGLSAADDLINDAKLRVSYRQALEAGEVQPETPEAYQISPEMKKWFNPFSKTVETPSAEVAEKETLSPHGEESAGTKLGDWIFDKGREAISKSIGEVVGDTVGGIAGSLAGHPVFGAYLGSKTLAPVIAAVAKPMLEGVTDGGALKGTIDFLSAAVKGTKALDGAVKSLFEGSKVLTPQALPSQSDRDKLQTALDALNDPTRALQVGGSVGHYLPDHGTAAGALAGSAKSYLDSIKPKALPTNPFNQAPPVSRAAQTAYDRQLDVAQQPLMVLKHAQDGTLLARDVATLDTLYPGLRKAIADKVTSQFIEAKGKSLPYHQRISLQLLTGSTPLDGSMEQPRMAAIIRAQGPQQAQNRARGGSQAQKGATAAQLKTIDKAQEMYELPGEARKHRP